VPEVPACELSRVAARACRGRCRRGRAGVAWVGVAGPGAGGGAAREGARAAGPVSGRVLAGAGLGWSCRVRGEGRLACSRPGLGLAWVRLRGAAVCSPSRLPGTVWRRLVTLGTRGTLRERAVDGEVLRAWRRSRGWDAPEMARRLRRAATERARSCCGEPDADGPPLGAGGPARGSGTSSCMRGRSGSLR